jgi:hypothetical protein
MNARRLDLGGLLNVEIVSVTLDGEPSAVHSALHKLYFNNGQVIDWRVYYEPDGIMYENFLESINGVLRQISKG